MKKVAKILSGVVFSLNLLKILAYAVPLVLIVTNKPNSGDPGWLAAIAYMGAMMVAVVLIPYVILLVCSLLFYVLGLIKKHIGLFNVSAVFSLLGSILAGSLMGYVLIELLVNSAGNIYVGLITAYFVVEAILAILVLVFNSTGNKTER